MSHLKPTNDFIFKEIFGKTENADILKDLLQSILTDIQINEVEINKDVTLQRELIVQKLGILDVVATLDDTTKVNVEMQVRNYHNTVERSLFYGTGVYHENLETGKEYEDIPRSISIWITNYNVFEEGPFHERARLKRDYENIILTDKLEVHYIQLPKFRRKCKRISSRLDEWLTFIENENVEAIKMIKNKHVQKAEKEYEYLTGDAAKKRIAELREKYIRDDAAAKISMERYGRQEGIKEGIKEGIEKGKTENKKEIAKKMLAKGMDVILISEITELTKEEIEKL